MQTITLIIIIVLTIVYFMIYHAKFHIAYFGNPFAGMLKELFSCFVVALITVVILGQVLMSLLGAVGSAFGFIWKMIVVLIKIIAALAAVGGTGYMVYKLINRKSVASQHSQKQGETCIDDEVSIVFCSICGHKCSATDEFCEECGNVLM